MNKNFSIKLPTRLYLPKNITTQGEQAISDYLSDKIGYCHYGFDIKKYRNKLYATNIKWDRSE